MEAKTLATIERFDTDKHVHIPVFNGERMKVLLLCLGPHQSVPPHAHPGVEITLQPLKGRAVLPTAGASPLWSRGRYSSSTARRASTRRTRLPSPCRC